MRIARYMCFVGLAAASVIATEATDAAAVARARATVSSGAPLLLTANNGVLGDDALARMDLSTQTITVEILGGTTGARARLLTPGGALVGNCTLDDPAPPDGNDVDKVCNTIVGATFLDLSVD